jgi:hypothetical protein
MPVLSYAVDWFPEYGIIVGPVMIAIIAVGAACFAMFPDWRKTVLILLGTFGPLGFIMSFGSHFLPGIIIGLSTLTSSAFLALFYFDQKPDGKNQAAGVFFVAGFIEFVPIILFCFSQSAQVLGNWGNPMILGFLVNSLAMMASAGVLILRKRRSSDVIERAV